MLTLKTLYWSNAFSYGLDNEIKLNGSTVTQLIGTNGAGKSSIPLILQEILYNKNSKSVKKADILNRDTKDKSYSIAVDFDLNGSEYFFSTVRKGATTKAELLKDGEDISGHTATSTYKLVSELLGMDFSTFCQLVYQSANSSLEFLTATDTQRKKFLISLLNLGDYTTQEQNIKKIFSKVSTELAVIEASVETISTWLEENQSIDTTTRDLQEVPQDPQSFREKLAELKYSHTNAESINTKIAANNKARRVLEEKEATLPESKPPTNITDINHIVSKRAMLTSENTASTKMITKLTNLDSKCPTCMSDIDKANVDRLVAEETKKIAANTLLDKDLATQYQEANKVIEASDYYNAIVRSIEFAKQKYDEGLPTELVSVDKLAADITTLNAKISKIVSGISKIRASNLAAESHNEKVAYILAQSEKYKNSLSEKMIKLSELTDRCGRLGILKRAFGTKGLVAYKIESMIKDLEVLINKYLIEMSDGRFNLAFVVSGDKLNIELLDGSNPISITALSSGELARVNIATLLAIRNLMNTLSNTKLNLLFLDEVTTVLDDEGKERLVEVLSKEKDINAFIVSHGWQHPLVDKIEVIKEDNMSRIEV
jgi:DNA repair exonuclease SbcCD ATPase subunit